MKKLLLLLTIIVPYANAAEYFVATNGNSGNNGSTGAPWPLQYALDQIVPGITITVMPGLYSGVYLIQNKMGAPGNLATVRSQYKWQAVLSNATNQSAGLFTANTTNVVLDGLCVSNAPWDGINMNGHSNTIRNCWVVNSWRQGIALTSINCSNNIAEYNLVENNGLVVSPNCHGMYISGPNNVVRGNVVRRNNSGFGIIVYSSYAIWQNNNLVYNNLTYGHTNKFGLGVTGAVGDDPGAGTLPGTNYVYGNTILDGVFLAMGTVYFTNNIILPSAVSPSGPFSIYAGNPIVITNDYNLSTLSFFNEDGSVAGANDVITSNVGFVNTNSGLYWLKDNSPARGVAHTLVLGPVDFFGNAQTQVFDIGAFQHTQALASDVRVFDPSPATGADYWQPYAPTTTGQQLSIGTVTIQNLRVQ